MTTKFSIANFTLPHWLEVGASMFLGAAADAALNLVLTGGLPKTAAQWQALGVAALMAGLGAIRGINTSQPKAPPGDGPGGGDKVSGDVPTTTSGRPVPPASLRFRGRMRSGIWAAGFLLTMFAFGGSTEGCGWWSANSNTVVRDLGAIGECVLAQLFGGTSDPSVITKNCVGATMQDVADIITSLLDFYRQQPSGGPTATSTICGVGTPPVAGAPECISMAQVAMLHTAHARAKEALDKAGQ